MRADFTRQLGAAPGVQLDPTIDDTLPSNQSDADTMVATLAHLTRGRTDRAFVVNSSNYDARLGRLPSLKRSRMSEALYQIRHFLDTYPQGRVVVSRLAKAGAVTKPIYIGVSGLGE
ncbi:MAG: hypothetical protein VXW65_00325 [Pseudomonadota bacterium]|nr:hypothetical protein [Pseudomonadota bacterium]